MSQMDKKEHDENSPSNLWTRRSNTSKLSLATTKADDRDPHTTPSTKRFGSINSKSNPFNALNPVATAVASPTSTGASSAFGLGSGAFASFGTVGKTPNKTPGPAFDPAKATATAPPTPADNKDDKDARRPLARKSIPALKSASSSAAPAPEPAAAAPPRDPSQWALKHAWVTYYRPPTSKNSDYEKSIKPLCRAHTAQEFWQVYAHLKRPSALPTVSDYHFFKDGIRPVWECEENRHGGKWTMRLKKGVADRYWEDLLLAMIGEQFAEASEEVCGAVVSVRSGEDVFSIWTKNDGGRNVKIRETIKRVLALPPDTALQWRSHDESITQRQAVDAARLEKAGLLHGGERGGEKRRGTLGGGDKGRREEEGEA
ncbi:hypothetical protein LTR08_006169 [Meristemomyces frigidus]|nr:hypothetical protein LTR08_006169 [Meristemomyces frigidus]